MPVVDPLPPEVYRVGPDRSSVIPRDPFDRPGSIIPQPEPLTGCWVAYCLDWHEIFKAVFAEEVEARRYAMQNHLDVKFVKWGEES